MNKQARAVARGFHFSRRWAWVSLVPFLAGACKQRDLLCEHGSYFQVLQPEQGAGVAPFSIERLGPQVRSSDLRKVLDALTLKSDNRVRGWWTSLGHIYRDNDLIFSPAEGLARNVDMPDDVYPMKRFSEGTSERVRFGFRSTTCRVRGKGVAFCQQGDDDLFLAVEMTCLPDDS